MKFGVREICDVVFKAKSNIKIGTTEFKRGQPVLYIDTAKTSTTEGAATTVYATGGKGNTRLIAWEGEKTLTFTVEDALLSPIGFAVLSGAGLFKGEKGLGEVHVHATANAFADGADGTIDLTDALGSNEKIDATAPVFVIATEEDGSLSTMITNCEVEKNGKRITCSDESVRGKAVFVDFYTVKSAAAVSELQIDMARFGGYYYVEASTLFRRQNDGVDMPAELTFPNVKIQSNFTFSMASTGDPSTFTFTMDALPGYTMFDRTRKVLCVMQIVEDTEGSIADEKSVMSHPTGFDIAESAEDSTTTTGEVTAGALTYKLPSADEGASEKWLNKNPATFISDETYVQADGTVRGELKYVKDFAAFNPSNPTEQEGNYFPIELTTDAEYITITKDGQPSVTHHQFKDDNDKALIIRLTPDTAQMNWVITTEDADGVPAEQMKLNFKKATLEPAKN